MAQFLRFSYTYPRESHLKGAHFLTILHHLLICDRQVKLSMSFSICYSRRSYHPDGLLDHNLLDGSLTAPIEVMVEGTSQGIMKNKTQCFIESCMKRFMKHGVIPSACSVQDLTVVYRTKSTSKHSPSNFNFSTLTG